MGKLSDDDAIEIVIRIWKGETKKSIAKKFQVSQMTIHRIATEETHDGAAYWAAKHLIKRGYGKPYAVRWNSRIPKWPFD